MPGNEKIGTEEFDEIKHLFDNGACLFRHGYDQSRNGVYKVAQFEKNFSEHMGVEYSLAVSSGTAALRVALAALDIGTGDEVITQSFTFVATSEAIIEAGATPVFTNISSNLNMCPLDLANKITPNTKAIIVVHMLGVPCSMTEIMQLANQKGIPVIEDTAWGCGGKYDANYLGTIGRMGTYSFDHAKLMTTGEGGMVVFQNKEDYEKAAAWHDHGHENNPHLPRWKDSRSSSGFNYRMSELQGAVGLAQLKKLNSFVKIQRENALSIIDELRTVRNIKIRSEPSKAFST
jgi:8-amino-3,8-dideoxy-alpha-D-manno-octulosonate transaminase